MYQQMCAELPPYSSTVTETSLAGMISWDTGEVTVGKEQTPAGHLL